MRRHLLNQKPGGLQHILHAVLPLARRLPHRLNNADAAAAAVGEAAAASGVSEIKIDFVVLLVVVRGGLPPLRVRPAAARR